MIMAAQPEPVWPCSVCFGAGDPDSAGFAWGVLILLVPVALVQFLLVRFVLRAIRRERLTGSANRAIVEEAPSSQRPDGPLRGMKGVLR